MIPYTVDANAIHAFQKERSEDLVGPAHDAINSIFASDCIALDEGELCLQEWAACAGGSFPLNIRDWAADQMVVGKIRNFPLCSNTIRKELLSIGLPQDDHKWVRLSIGCEGRVIVTDDIDFFDPTKKNASAATKEKIKSSGSGPCSKKLSKKFGIKIKRLCDMCEA